MPKQASKAGSITQWISVCRCDAVSDMGLDGESSVKFCDACGKRIAEGRQGSFTQWVFRGSGDTCQCKGEQYLRSIGVDPNAPAVETASAPEVQDEGAGLELAPDVFPVGRYKPLRELGSGAFSTVYLCRDLMLKKKVAVKVLRLLSPAQLVLFQNEARATSKLTHPGIVKILDFGALETGVPYMVLEYVNGQSLEHELEENGPLPAADAFDVFYFIADALKYAHENGIYHRDLKPTNILQGPQNALLIDFGVAHLKNEEMPAVVQGKTLVGTPAYMSPDQLDGKAYDSRSEIYSFGCALFETLTGAPPFAAETPLELLSMHQHQTPPQINEVFDEANVSVDVEKFMVKCLAKSPDDRFQNFAEVKEAMRGLRLHDDQSEPAVHAGSKGGSGKSGGRAIVLVFCAIVAILGCVVLATTTMSPSQQIGVSKKGKKTKSGKLEHAGVQNQAILGVIKSDKTPFLPKADSRDLENDNIWAAGDDMYGVKEEKPANPSDAKFVETSEPDGFFHEAANDRITDEDLKELSTNKNLRALSVRGCTSLTGTGFKYLQPTSVQQLDMKWINLTDEGAENLALVQSLRMLNCCHINLSMNQIGSIAKLKNLENLSICHSQLTDDGLKLLSSIKSLRVLNLEGNINITFKGVESLKGSGLQRFRIYGCEKIMDLRRLRKILPTTQFEMGNYMRPEPGSREQM